MKYFKGITILLTGILLTFTFVNCDNGDGGNNGNGQHNNSCSHEWEWVVTAKATIDSTGVETETCKKCKITSGKTKNIPKLTQIPAPANVTGMASSSGSITITWGTVANAKNYKVYRSSSSAGAFDILGAPLSASFTDTGLFANTAYYYKVSAVNNNDEEGTLSNITSVTTLPDAPTGLTATATSTSSVTFSWNPVEGADMYVFYFISINEDYIVHAYIRNGATQYVRTGMTPGQSTGEYYITAFNGTTNLESVRAGPISGTTLTN